MDRLRPPRQDDPGRLAGRDLLDGEVVGNDLGVDMALTDPARDQLGVLGSVVDDQDSLVGWRGFPRRHKSIYREGFSYLGFSLRFYDDT